jgi:hypothetical protein
VKLDEESGLKICFFPKNTEIQGYLCKGGVGGTEGVMTSFYPSGRLKAFFTPSNVIIQGVSCRKGIFSSIYLNENGNLNSCTLSADAEVNGQRISARSEITISEDGNVTILDDSWKKRTSLWFAGLFGY